MTADPNAGRLRRWWRALRYLFVGVGTALLNMFTLFGLLVVVILIPLGVGLAALPEAARVVRWVVDLDRRRAARYLGERIPASYLPVTGSLSQRVRAVVTDPATWRDLVWLLVAGLPGMVLGMLACALPLAAVNQLFIPAYWWAAPGQLGNSLGAQVNSWPMAWLSVPIGLGWAVFSLVLPVVARGEARLARVLLRPAPGVALTDRVAQLTASRAAALDAHGAELRRIERDLHDGTQARIAAVIMQLGIADQLYERDGAAALGLIRKAQDTATVALAELREVVRSIYPPVLSDRGLDGAVTALAARSPVQCVLDIGHIGRRPAAVEAAAYFIIAEALTNVTKHSGAQHCAVGLNATEDTLFITVSDDGHGGADESQGSGLAGIRRRVEAFDGRTELNSPVGGPTELRVELPCGS